MGGYPKVLSCGVVVVRLNERATRFLMLRAYRHWDFPKGLRETSETPLQAAIREVEEETCVRDLDFAWGEQYLETGPYSRGKIARYYLARTVTTEICLPVNPALGRPEHNAWRWLRYTEARKLSSPRVGEALAWAAGILRSAGASV